MGITLRLVSVTISDSQSDTLKRKDSRTDKEGEVLVVEEHNVGEAIVGDCSNLARGDIYDCDQLSMGEHSRPMRMKTSATRAVPESLARLRIIASGRKMMSCAQMSVPVEMKVLQFVTARTKAWRFSAMKIVYAESAGTHKSLTCNESDLGDSDGDEDCKTHVGTVQCPSDV